MTQDIYKVIIATESSSRGKKTETFNTLCKTYSLPRSTAKKFLILYQTAQKSNNEKIKALFWKAMNKELSVYNAYRLAKQELNNALKESIKSKEDLTDEEILIKHDIKIQPYNVWTFNTCNSNFGARYPGRIPGQIVIHTLYFFTEQGDLVIDPMAGSGTVIDCAQLMKRQAIGYDINPTRNDIIKRDILTELFPEQVAEGKLIFWDPPYYKKMDKYYGTSSISKLNKKEYLEFFDKAANDLKNKRFNGYLAFLCSDYNDEKSPEENIFIWDYVSIFNKHGFMPIHHIHVPLTPQIIHPDIVIKFRKQKRLARLSRSLVVFKVI
jgi:hypothetical protein